MGYKTDRKWSDEFINQVAQILKQNALHLVRVEVAPDETDCKQATDLTVDVVGGKVAVRVRRPYQHYRDLTIRSRRASGTRTELQKLRDGFADWYLYGWTDDDGDIAEWMLVDLGKVRETGRLEVERREIRNYDGVTWFIAIPAQELQQHHCIVASQLPMLGRMN